MGEDDIFFGRDMLQELSFFLVLLTAGLGREEQECMDYGERPSERAQKKLFLRVPMVDLQ